MNREESTGVSCPKCGWSDVQEPNHARFLDRALAFVFLAPLRCQKCRLRFYRPKFIANRVASSPAPAVETRIPLPLRTSSWRETDPPDAGPDVPSPDSCLDPPLNPTAVVSWPRVSYSDIPFPGLPSSETPTQDVSSLDVATPVVDPVVSTVVPNMDVQFSDRDAPQPLPQPLAPLVEMPVAFDNSSDKPFEKPLETPLETPSEAASQRAKTLVETPVKASPLPADAPPLAVETEPATVLLVDEDAAMRKLLAMLLSREGYAVRHAADSGEAAAELSANGIDVVVANLSDGRPPAAIREWRAAHPELSIIAFSSEMEQKIPSCMETTVPACGTNGTAENNIATLPWPSRPRDVVRAVQGLLEVSRKREASRTLDGSRN